MNADRGNYSFLNPPSECRDEINGYVRYCKANSVTPRDCLGEYAASWMVLLQRLSDQAASNNPSSDSQDTNFDEDKDYAARNNPFEYSMLECFSMRIALGGDWYDDDALKSARQLTRTQACSDITKTYFYWCKNNGGNPEFCDALTVKGAQIIISSIPYESRVRELPEASQQMDTATSAEIIKMAKTGNPAAQNKLGKIYYEGSEVPQNYSEAFKWFQKSANNNYSKAQYNLGQLYRQGKGIKQDYQEAAKWYLKAAKQGYSPAQVAMGQMYRAGMGVTLNEAQALHWFKKASAQNDPIGQLKLGAWYALNGKKEEAIRWLTKSAEQGNQEAEKLLNNITSIKPGS